MIYHSTFPTLNPPNPPLKRRGNLPAKGRGLITVPEECMAKKKYVYFFGNGRAEGRSDMKELLGGKGAGLAEMTNIGLPVPAGFTITTEVCDAYYKNNHKYPSGLKQEVEKNLKHLEKLVGKTLGDSNDPLLVSVRSGASRSMPGMMETILNLGLNDRSVEGSRKRPATGVLFLTLTGVS